MQRKQQPEARATLRIVARAHAAAMLEHDFVADREAQSRSAAGALGRKERLEHPREMAGRNTGARIANKDLDAIVAQPALDSSHPPNGGMMLPRKFWAQVRYNEAAFHIPLLLRQRAAEVIE